MREDGRRGPLAAIAAAAGGPARREGVAGPEGRCRRQAGNPLFSGLLMLLLLPAGLLVAGAALTLLLRRRLPVAAAAWLALTAEIAIYVPTRAVQELISGGLGFGAQLTLRLDAVSFAFTLFLLLPAAVLLTFQPRTGAQGAAAGLAAAAAVLCVQAGGLLLAAVAGGTAGSLVLLDLDLEAEPAPRRHWLPVRAAWLGVAWTAVLLQVAGGTAVYSAVPVSALSVPICSLLVVAALLASGLVPGVPLIATGQRGLAAALLFPLGFYLLVRAYDLGAGRLPAPWLNLALVAAGALIALLAAWRGQAATSRRDYLAEVLPGLGGLAVFGLGLGTALGLTAAVTSLAAAALLAGLLPLMPERTPGPVLLGLAAAAGIPPGLGFAGRLLTYQGALEAGEAKAMLGILVVAAWLLTLAGAARAVRLPAGRVEAPGRAGAGFAAGLAGLVLAGGAGLGLLASGLAVPAAQEALGQPGSPLTGGLLTVTSAAGSWAAVTLAGPVILLGLLGAAASWRAWPSALPARPEGPPPLLSGPGPIEVAGLRLAAPSVDEYRSLFNPAAIDRALSSGQPWLWVAVLLALALVVLPNR